MGSLDRKGSMQVGKTSYNWKCREKAGTDNDFIRVVIKYICGHRIYFLKNIKI